MTTARMGGSSSGIAFLVSAGITYEIIAACCSSPQTTEINADKRADTLMKWVHIGAVQAAGFVLVAAMFDQGNWMPIVSGGMIAVVILYWQYYHAKKAGLASSLPGTED